MKRQIHLTMPEKDHAIITENALAWFRRHNLVPKDIRKLSPQDNHSVSRIRTAFVLSLAKNYNSDTTEAQLRASLRDYEQNAIKVKGDLQRKDNKIAELNSERDTLLEQHREQEVQFTEARQKLRIIWTRLEMAVLYLTRVPKWVLKLFGITFDEDYFSLEELGYEYDNKKSD